MISQREPGALLALISLFLLASSVLIGCSEPQARDDSHDPLAYAADIKNEAVTLLSLIKKQPARGAEYAGYLIEYLTDTEDPPVGEFGGIYQTLLSGAEELKSLRAGSPEQAKKISELLAVAESLPGQLRPPDADD